MARKVLVGVGDLATWCGQPTCSGARNPCWHTWDTLIGGIGSPFCTNPVCDPSPLEPRALPVLRMLSVQSTCSSAHRVEDTQAPHTGGRTRKGVRGSETSLSICLVCACSLCVGTCVWRPSGHAGCPAASLTSSFESVFHSLEQSWQPASPRDPPISAPSQCQGYRHAPRAVSAGGQTHMHTLNHSWKSLFSGREVLLCQCLCY